MMISNIRENGETIGALPDGEMNFHHDMIHAELPHNGTLLYSVDIPTPWRRHAVRERLRGLRHARPGDPQSKPRRPQGAQPLQLRHHHPGRHRKAVEAFAEAVHPAFRTHDQTGRKAIYVDRLMTIASSTCRTAESDALLNAVFDHSERGEFVYRHVWRRRRSHRVGQPLLVARARRFSVGSAPADAAHDDEGDGAAVLTGRSCRRPELR